jgi:hypothetical protein
LKGWKSLVGLALFPVCLGATRGLWRVCAFGAAADRFWAAALAGAASWLSVFALLPRPIRLYVFGHELTHALWAWLFGGRIRGFRATARGGYVETDRINFLVVLAPYFFPLYALLVAGVYATGNALGDWRPFAPWFHLLLGAAYTFHVTMTVHVLRTPQSDLAHEGYFFSAMIIWLGNVLILLLAVPILTSQVSVPTAFQWAADETTGILRWLAGLRRAN